jgi:DNA repair exonuclease SbcCD nuclease subunit
MSRHFKLCHTSDWHLGHTLLGHGREHEHERFLAFLLDTLVEEQVDALVVIGDVFDGRTRRPPRGRCYGSGRRARPPARSTCRSSPAT